jgi:CHAT domain-containing protein
LLGNPPFDVIHYAGHAAFDAERPGESDLKLSDGVVPARDIESTLSYRPLIFLNACEAGYQQSEDLPGSYMGSEIEGLAASCLLGGARGCIGPLWRVPDGQVADFAIAFYKHALDGDSLGTALRLARLESRKDAPITKVWAAYVLYGDPTVQLL